jgi:hypothetical protein
LISPLAGILQSHSLADGHYAATPDAIGHCHITPLEIAIGHFQRHYASRHITPLFATSGIDAIGLY